MSTRKPTTKPAVPRNPARAPPPEMDLSVDKTVQRLAQRLQHVAATPLMLHKPRPPPTIFKESAPDADVGLPYAAQSAMPRFTERKEARERVATDMDPERRSHIQSIIERKKATLHERKAMELENLQRADREDLEQAQDHTRGALLSKRLLALGEDEEIVLDRTLEVKAMAKPAGTGNALASVRIRNQRGSLVSSLGLYRKASLAESIGTRLDDGDGGGGGGSSRFKAESSEPLNVGGRRLILHKSEENEVQIEEMAMSKVYGLIFKVENIRGVYDNISNCPERESLKKKFKIALLNVSEAIRATDGAVYNRLIVAQSRLLMALQQIFSDEDVTELMAAAKAQAGKTDARAESTVDTIVPRQFTRIVYAPSEEERAMEQKRLELAAAKKMRRGSAINEELSGLLRSSFAAPSGVGVGEGASAATVFSDHSPRSAAVDTGRFSTGEDAAAWSPATRRPWGRALSIRQNDPSTSGRPSPSIALRAGAASFRGGQPSAADAMGSRSRRSSAPFTPTASGRMGADQSPALGADSSFSNNGTPQRPRLHTVDEISSKASSASGAFSPLATEIYDDDCSLDSEYSLSLRSTTDSRCSVAVEELPPPSTHARRKSVVAQTIAATPLSHRPDVPAARAASLLSSSPSLKNATSPSRRLHPDDFNISESDFAVTTMNRRGSAASSVGPDRRSAAKSHEPLSTGPSRVKIQASSGGVFEFTPGGSLGDIKFPAPIIHPEELGETSFGEDFAYASESAFMTPRTDGTALGGGKGHPDALWAAAAPSVRPSISTMNPHDLALIQEEDEEQLKKEERMGDGELVDFAKIRKAALKHGPKIRTADAKANSMLYGRSSVPSVLPSGVRLLSAGATRSQRSARPAAGPAPLTAAVSDAAKPRGSITVPAYQPRYLLYAAEQDKDRIATEPILPGLMIRERPGSVAYLKKRIPAGPRRVSKRIRDRAIDPNTPFVDPMLMQNLIKKPVHASLRGAIVEYLEDRPTRTQGGAPKVEVEVGGGRASDPPTEINYQSNFAVSRMATNNNTAGGLGAGGSVLELLSAALGSGHHGAGDGSAGPGGYDGEQQGLAAGSPGGPGVGTATMSPTTVGNSPQVRQKAAPASHPGVMRTGIASDELEAMTKTRVTLGVADSSAFQWR